MTGARVLAIDLGTTSCKAGLFINGTLSSVAAEPIRTDHPAAEWAEQDPDEWWSTIVRVVRAVVSSAANSIVDGIALCGQSDSLVPIDASGRAVYPCILWMDRRGLPELDRAVEILGIERIRHLTGLYPGINFTAPKAAWLAGHRPDAYARASWIVQPKDAILGRMIGRVVTDPSSASRSLLYDIDAGAWAPDLVDAFGLDIKRLPPIVESASEAGRLTASAAQALGLVAGIPVAAGAADRAAEALGVALGATDTLVSTGTATGVVRAMAGLTIVDDPAVITPAHAIAGERLAILSHPTSGAVLAWFDQLVSTSPLGQALEEEARLSPVGANGVVALTHFMGARSVRWDPRAKGAFLGLTLATNRGDMARAIIEGVAFEINACLQRLATIGAPTGRLILAGGAHRSSLWAQILADVSGLPSVRYGDDDASLVGAMMLATGAIENVTELRSAAAARLEIIASYQPNPDRHSAYASASDRYEALYAAVNRVV